jgi:hypothetical protein
MALHTQLQQETPILGVQYSTKMGSSIELQLAMIMILGKINSDFKDSAMNVTGV